MAFLEMFVGPVPTTSKDVYHAYAAQMGALTMQAGAMSVTACWGADGPQGVLSPLAGAVKADVGETIVARIVRWSSKAARDEGWAAMMKTPDLQAASIPVPFDRARVCYAAFDELGE